MRALLLAAAAALLVAGCGGEEEAAKGPLGRKVAAQAKLDPTVHVFAEPVKATDNSFGQGLMDRLRSLSRFVSPTR